METDLNSRFSTRQRAGRTAQALEAHSGICLMGLPRPRPRVFPAAEIDRTTDTTTEDVCLLYWMDQYGRGRCTRPLAGMLGRILLLT